MSGKVVVPGIELLLNKDDPKCGLFAFDGFILFDLATRTQQDETKV